MRRGGGDHSATRIARRGNLEGAKIVETGTIATLNPDMSGLVNCSAGATSPSWVEVPTPQHSLGFCAGGRGQSFEQHSSARALPIAARQDAAPPPSTSVRTMKIVANRRIVSELTQMLCRSRKSDKVARGPPCGLTTLWQPVRQIWRVVYRAGVRLWSADRQSRSLPLAAYSRNLTNVETITDALGRPLAPANLELRFRVVRFCFRWGDSRHREPRLVLRCAASLVKPRGTARTLHLRMRQRMLRTDAARAGS